MMVSIIIPTYNREYIIKKSIDSVLAQTYSDFELIIVDDGSKDNTRELVESIEDPRVRYVYQDNAGACAARNHGISLAQGDYIAFHDSDDIWHPDKLEKQMKILEQDKADICICKLITERNGQTMLFPKRIGEGVIHPVRDLLGIGTQTIVAKRKVFESCHFDASMPRYQDFEFLYNAVQQFRIYCIDEGLVDYVIGADSISSNPAKMYAAVEIILQRHPEINQKYPLICMHFAKDIRNNKKNYNGELDEARYQNLLKALKVNPWSVLKALM